MTPKEGSGYLNNPDAITKVDVNSLPNSIITTSLPESNYDAFGHIKFSSPHTLFDSKQLGDQRNLFWDIDEITATGTPSSVYNANAASTTLTVGPTEIQHYVRQTFQRFNYQPGKSQEVEITARFGDTPSGITKRAGLFDGSNGMFFQLSGSQFSIGLRSSTSGSPVDTIIDQANWSEDTMNPDLGNNPSGIRIDPTRRQIFFIDYEWLAVGTIRFGLFIDGQLFFIHKIHHANTVSSIGAYMTTPNLPIRYEILNDGTGATSSMETICVTIKSYGGQENTGIVRGESGGGTPTVSSGTSGVLYAGIGIRLKTIYYDNILKLLNFSMASTTNDAYEWQVLLNPTVAGTFTYSSVANSAAEVARGSGTTNTVTGGTILDAGYAAANTSVSELSDTIRYLGNTIDGTPDEIVICHRPLGANADIYTAINWIEAS